MKYEEFLKQKVATSPDFGFQVDRDALSDVLKPHQKDIVQWAIAGGRRAIFAAFGMGKSVMQLETLRAVREREGGPVLVICPLGVRLEFAADAHMLGQETRFIRRDDEVDPTFTGTYLTNYESVRDGKLSPDQFTGVSLDEASVLRSFGSKTYQTFLNLFAQVPYRFVATATPSPNRFKELIHYAGFLGVMDTGQALTRFFQRDSTKANNLTLYPHKEREFWLWLNTWACFIQTPADLGYDATGYDLTPLHREYREVTISLADDTADRDGQAHMFRSAELGLKEAAREKRLSLTARIDEAMRILEHEVDASEQAIIWCDLNDEQDAIEKSLRVAGVTFSSIRGSQSPDEVERLLFAWKNRDTRILVGKPIMLGQGMNLQQCRTAIFLGVTYKFNDTIQAVHRIHRYGQTLPCHVYLIHANSETGVVRELETKWTQHEELTSTMSNVLQEHGLNSEAIAAALTRSMGVDRIEAEGDGWLVANNDCVEEVKLIDDNTIDMIVTSIPFANHYEYTPSYNDFGHTDDNDQFWAQMDYLTPELLRILAPGRIYACHVKDRILFGAVTGAGVPTVSPFHAEALNHGIKHGFDYLGMITVVTDVVRENNQTYRLGYTEMRKDGTKMGAGSPEYILLFHKPQTNREKGYADTPVSKSIDDYSLARWQVDAHAFWRSSGERHMTPDELAALPPEQLSRTFTEQTLSRVYDYESHVRVGEQLAGRGSLPSTFMALAPGSWHPDVWHDVNRMLTLNGEQSRRAQAMHVCLSRGSRVLTKERGYVPIEEVNVGEHTLTHKGNWKPVLAVQNTGVRPVVKVQAQGVPGLILTPDHKLWARDPRGYKRQADYVSKVEPDWLPAADSKGAYVNLKQAAPELNAGDETLWWTVGRWIADGHWSARGEAFVSIGEHKWDDFLARVGRFGGNTARMLAAVQVSLRDPDRELRNILTACGRRAGGKQLPPEAYTLSTPLAAALLEGYLSGDGHMVKSRNTWQCTTVSRDLALGLAALAHRAYGVSASVTAGRPARRGRILGRDVNMQQEWQVSFNAPGDERRKKPIHLADGMWKKVRSVEEVGEVETWNLRVADDESYTAEGCIVKNCPLQFDIVDRLIERYSNKGDLIFDPFGGLFTVPLRAMKLGRRGRAAELNPGYFLDGVKYLEAEERKQDMPSLFDLDEVAIAV